MNQFKDKNALLTGASRGIGVPIARELARQGLNLAISARPPSLEQLNTLAGELRQTGVRVIPIPADLSRPEQRQSLVAQAQAELGPIDVLINNAGIEHLASFIHTDEGMTRQIIETNLVAPMELVRLVLPGMLERHRGHIVNIASMAGKSPAAYNAVYSASKAGLINWSLALRTELEASGVSISVVCPGYISEVGMHARTGMTPPWIAREVSPQKVVQAVSHALQRDLPEVLVWPGPVRPLLAIKELAPGMVSFFYKQLGLTEFMRRSAADTEGS